MEQTEQIEQVRVDSKHEVAVDDGLGVVLNKKTLFHGSATPAIKQFTIAEEDTVGSGVYLTSTSEEAAGYAKRRAKRLGATTPVVYEVLIDHTKLLDLRRDENVKRVLASFEPKLAKELQDSQKPWYHQGALRQAIEAIKSGEVGSGNLREVAFSVGKLFSDHVKSLGYEGLVTFEGGEGEEIGDHKTYLIFDPEKIKITTEQKIATEKEKRFEKLFGHCFEIAKIEEGDLLPVGGENFLSQETNIQVRADLNQFSDFYQEVSTLASKYKLEELKKWLQSQGITGDERLFAFLFAFTKTYEKKYPPGDSNKAEIRKELYKSGDKQIKLSDVFGRNAAECAEIAAAAQYFLQREDIDSKYFSGDVLWERDREYSEEHSFIVIRHGDRVYIFDPTNPTDTTQGKFPSVYTVEADFEKEVRKNQKRFVTAKNIISKKEAFFGVSDGTNISAANIA